MKRSELLKVSKPILFNTEMVRTILEGRKTVTRRVIDRDIVNHCDMEKDGTLLNYEDDNGDFINPVDLCRYKKEQYLYVRETWRKHSPGTDIFIYRADYPDEYHRQMGFKPSIHMPKDAARIFLKVTNVSVERLQDITEGQALAEGIPDDWPMDKVYCPKCHGEGLVGALGPNLGFMEIECSACEKATQRFKNLWNSTINSKNWDKYCWEANPYVWVIRFERVEVEE